MHSDYLKRFWTGNQGDLKVFAVGVVHVVERRTALEQD
jgi:hypothetical protein